MGTVITWQYSHNNLMKIKGDSFLRQIGRHSPIRQVICQTSQSQFFPNSAMDFMKHEINLVNVPSRSNRKHAEGDSFLELLP